MKLVKIDPPGTFCTHEALRDVMKKTKAHSFVDVGCGGGDISKLLCSFGLTGTGIDFSPLAIEASSRTLEQEIAAGKYTLIEADATALPGDVTPSDLAISFMVMEHVEGDVSFVRALSKLVNAGGYVAVCVPGRRDRWSFEDETVGHLRRYDRDDLERVLVEGGLRDVQIWSVAVPIGNILFRLSDWLVRHSDEAKKIGLSARRQTESSGLRDIPWKTVFPAWFRLFLNRYTLYPLFVIQRLFYSSALGVTMLGFGRVDHR